MANTPSYLIDIDPDTLEYVSGWARGQKSIRTILQTRLNTRIMREWFGSDFLNIQDKPLSQEVWVQSIIAAQAAVNQFEPEFKITSITITKADANGTLNAVVTVRDLIADQIVQMRTTF